MSGLNVSGYKRKDISHYTYDLNLDHDTDIYKGETTGHISTEGNRMAYETLKEEIASLSEDKILLLLDFARFLKQEDLHSGETQTNMVHKKRKIGFMAEDFISISPDFDTCLEGMEEYV